MDPRVFHPLEARCSVLIAGTASQLETSAVEENAVIVLILVDAFCMLCHLTFRHWLFPITVLTDSYVLVHTTANVFHDK